jgi:hypothetical protein
MDRERMLVMLKEGYTPEYVSLVKWRDVRRSIMANRTCGSINSETCALCEATDTTCGCRLCTLNQLVSSPCGIRGSPWHKVLWSNRNNLLTNVTNMINYLQVLVAIYGVKKNE